VLVLVVELVSFFWSVGSWFGVFPSFFFLSSFSFSLVSFLGLGAVIFGAYV
jgi:hypothetical protein